MPDTSTRPRPGSEYQEIFSGREELLEIDPTILPASIRIELVEIEHHQSISFRLTEQQQIVRQVATAADEIEALQNLSRVLNVLGIGHGHSSRSFGCRVDFQHNQTRHLCAPGRSRDHETRRCFQLVYPNTVPTRGE